MADPCTRSRCPGTLEVWATETTPAGRTLTWLVCDRDPRHTIERDQGPTAGDEQDALPGMDGR